MPRVKKVIPKTDAQLKDIEKAISRCFLFSSLDEDQRKEVSHPLPCSPLVGRGLGLDDSFMVGPVSGVLGNLFRPPTSSSTNRRGASLKEKSYAMAATSFLEQRTTFPGCLEWKLDLSNSWFRHISCIFLGWWICSQASM